MLIIVLSAYDQFEYAQRQSAPAKVFEYVLKPIRRGNFCTLLQKAAAAVRSKRAESSPDSQALYDEVRKIITDSLCGGIPQRASPWSDKAGGIAGAVVRLGRQKRF